MRENEKNCECRAENGNCLIIGGFCTSDPKEYCNMARRLQKYQALGTEEELREAMEKQRAKRPNIKVQEEDLHIGRITFKAGTKTYWCPSCDNAIIVSNDYCPTCGQAIKIKGSEERSNHEN